jgi:hypothetical protein
MKSDPWVTSFNNCLLEVFQTINGATQKISVNICRNWLNKKWSIRCGSKKGIVTSCKEGINLFFRFGFCTMTLIFALKHGGVHGEPNQIRSSACMFPWFAPFVPNLVNEANVVDA